MSEQTKARPLKMNADEFIAWAVELPKGQRFELVSGEVVVVSPERSAHALMKARIYSRLERAMSEAGVAGTVYPDGMSIRIDDDTVYDPDAQLRCGPPLPDDEVFVPDPVVVVEVLSPSTRGRDLGGKLEGYFKLPTLRHYLIVDIRRRTTTHHARDASGSITTLLLRDQPTRLDPPGLVIADPFDTPL